MGPVDRSDLPVKLNLVLEGDGSGTRVGSPMGWAVKVTWDGSSHWIIGANTTGTNNAAELFPYLVALWEHECLQRPPCRVIIVTDSQITVKCGRKEHSRSANRSLWSVIDYFEKTGYVFEWRHQPRNSSEAGTKADGLAGRAARLIGMTKS